MRKIHSISIYSILNSAFIHPNSTLKTNSQKLEKGLNSKMSEIYFIPFASEKHGSEECGKDKFSFLAETMETAIESWHETSSVGSIVYFLHDKEKAQTDKYPPYRAFELPQTHRSCFSFLRQYAVDSCSKAACLETSKNIIAYPQVWKGQGSRKWKHAQNDGFFVQFEFPSLRKLWFISSSNENGNTVQGARRFGRWCS